MIVTCVCMGLFLFSHVHRLLKNAKILPYHMVNQPVVFVCIFSVHNKKSAGLPENSQ